MPFYEYRRPDGTILEVMQKMTDPPLAEDPETGVPLQRIFHPIAVHFKGKGFYNTDYGTKKRAREKADHEGSKKKESGDSSSSDSDSGSGSGDSGGAGDAKPASESKAVQKLEAAKSETKKSSAKKKS